jgi:acetyl esterase/lipase
LDHPACAGFAHLLLPWDNRDYDATMVLRDIGSLLPYHSHVDPTVVVGALNRIIDDANAGHAVCHHIYTPKQKQEDPSRANTGLFFFRGQPGAPFAIIAPGGGFSYVGSVHEGFPYAVDISNKGYNAFVLRYRAGYGGNVASQDLAAAITWVFRHAGELGVSPEGYALWGSSAGARMAAAVGSHGVAAFGGDDLPEPSAIIMAYTGHSDTSSEEPPTFVVVGAQDPIAPPGTMKRRVDVLRRAGTPVEFHEYPGLGHGFGTAAGTCAADWIDKAIGFWSRAITPKN